VISIVIPAHDEERVIGRCLSGLASGAEPGELEVVVVANGCTDGTAAAARTFPGVRVVETPVAGKAAALNLGDEHATSFPRLYVDADVELGIDAVRAIRDTLDRGDVLAAAPRAELKLDGRPWTVRAYYQLWTTMMGMRGREVCAGVYAMSKDGRSRFGTFPDAIADDLFVRQVFTPGEWATIASQRAVVHPPRTLRSLIRVRTRVMAGNAQMKQARPASAQPVEGSRLLRMVARTPRMWPAAVVYGVVYTAARVRAEWKLRRGGVLTWERDDTAREAAEGTVA
jgi:glycosyltransferase involved in cell wall biosynthesis